MYQNPASPPRRERKQTAQNLGFHFLGFAQNSANLLRGTGNRGEFAGNGHHFMVRTHPKRNGARKRETMNVFLLVFRFFFGRNVVAELAE